MSVVKIKVFETSLVPSYRGSGVVVSPNTAAMETNVNDFLATLTSTNVLDVIPSFSETTKNGLGIIFQITIVYLG